MRQVEFSPEGTQLFASGYPSGLIQFWDLAARKEVHRIETPAGYRGTANYALLAPNWKSLYVFVEKRQVKNFERDGKRRWRIEYSGRIRVWDLINGKETDSIEVSPGSGPAFAELSPNGRYLTYVERPSQDNDQDAQDVTMVRDLTTSKQWKLCDGFAVPFIFPDGKTVAFSQNDFKAKTSSVRLVDLASGKELLSVSCPEKDRYFGLSSISPDGKTLPVALGGKKGAPVEFRFMDAKTLADRGVLLGRGSPEGYGWAHSLFTPDSKRFVSIDGSGDLLVWNVDDQRIERTLNYGGEQASWAFAIAPDGKTLAIVWTPKGDPAVEKEREPDPQEMPQPRVSLVDLDGKLPTRTFVAPHGFVGGLAFSPDGKTLAFGSSGGVHLIDLSK